MSLITIDQLLESVDLDFEPRWVTKDGNGDVYIFEDTPEIYKPSKQWVTTVPASGLAGYEGLKLAEFENKPWQECIYEVPRKTQGRLKRFTLEDFACVFDTENYHRNVLDSRAFDKLNELVDAVNELKERTEPKKLTGFAKTLSDLDMSKPMSTYTNKGAKNE